MNTAKPFYNHDSDSIIIKKKDKLEVLNWTDHLEFVNEELDYLLNIQDLLLNSHDLHQQLQNLRHQNQLKLAGLYRYGNTMHNAMECDTVVCDNYYLHNHEKARTLYMDHIKVYRNLKTKVLSKVLMYVKR